MRTSRVAGLLFLAAAALAQQQQPVEITSEPRHHLIFENEYVRVFDVTVAPRDTTLVHRHNQDYLFVTLGDSDVVSARPGEKPVALQLKDGEVRFTPGNFAHAAINNSDRPFHNTTIELLKPSTNVKTCTGPCDDLSNLCAGICAQRRKLISSDQWSVWLITDPPTAHAEKQLHAVPQLIVPVKSTGCPLVRCTRSSTTPKHLPASLSSNSTRRSRSHDPRRRQHAARHSRDARLQSPAALAGDRRPGCQFRLPHCVAGHRLDQNAQRPGHAHGPRSLCAGPFFLCDVSQRDQQSAGLCARLLWLPPG